MQALFIAANGGPEAVKLGEQPTPEPAPGEARVRVEAAALNHLDIWVRKGRPGVPARFPHVLGSDAAGTVDATGPGVVDWQPGDAVVVNPGLYQGSDPLVGGILGAHRPGTFAEYVCVPAASLAQKPVHLDWREAAALTLAHLTAYRMLASRAQVQAGETLLIHGIGGGVALAALQLAVQMGARVVVTSSSADKLERARAMGAYATVNYGAADDLPRAIREAAGGEIDVVADTVGAATWPVNLAVTRKGGRIVHVGITAGAETAASIATIYSRQLSVLGSTLGSRQELAALLRLVEVAALAPVIDTTYPLAEGPAAMARMEAGEQFGKLVLRLGGGGL